MKLTGSGIVALTLLLVTVSSGIWASCERSRRAKADAALDQERRAADSARAAHAATLQQALAIHQDVVAALSQADSTIRILTQHASTANDSAQALEEQLRAATTARDSIPLLVLANHQLRQRGEFLVNTIAEQQRAMVQLTQDRDSWMAAAHDTTALADANRIIARQAQELARRRQPNSCGLPWCPSSLELVLVGVLAGVAGTLAATH